MDTKIQELCVHFGRRLAARRTELGLSLAEVASRCGVSLQQVHRYETGDNVMSLPMFWSLCRCLDTPVSYFFEGLETLTREDRRITEAGHCAARQA